MSKKQLLLMFSAMLFISLHSSAQGVPPPASSSSEKKTTDTAIKKKTESSFDVSTADYLLDFSKYDWKATSSVNTKKPTTDTAVKKKTESSFDVSTADYLLDFSKFDWKDTSSANAKKSTTDTAVKKKTESSFDVSTADYLLDFSKFDWGAGSSTAAKAATTVTLGTQTWMAKNLDVSTFRNGDPIAEAKTDKEWLDAFQAKKPAWCYYNNDPANGATYGKLYNWYAVFDTRELAPAGWDVPTKQDWITLNTFFNGSGGKKMKSSSGWKEGGIYNNGTNEGNFSALPGGYRLPAPGSFKDMGNTTWWWTRTQTRMMGFEIGNGYRLDYNDSELREITPENEGLSVRCVKLK